MRHFFTVSIIVLMSLSTSLMANNVWDDDVILDIEEEVLFIDGKRVYNVVEKQPVFPGGHSSLQKFLQENVDYPQEAYNKKIQGRVLIEFIVHEDGTLSHFKVINDVHHLLAEEALRVSRLMPQW